MALTSKVLYVLSGTIEILSSSLFLSQKASS